MVWIFLSRSDTSSIPNIKIFVGFYVQNSRIGVNLWKTGFTVIKFQCDFRTNINYKATQKCPNWEYHHENQRVCFIEWSKFDPLNTVVFHMNCRIAVSSPCRQTVGNENFEFESQIEKEPHGALFERRIKSRACDPLSNRVYRVWHF